jgi:NitT/TauT family transport system permease protein
MTEGYRESVPVLTFPRQTFVSLLVFALAWETLSHLAPYLGIPPFAIPSFVRIAKSVATITPIDIVVTLARVIRSAHRFVFARRGDGDGDVSFGLARQVFAPDDPPSHGGAGGVMDFVRSAVVPGRRVPHLLRACGRLRAGFLIDTLDAMHGVPRDLRHMMQSFRPTTWQFFFKLMLPAILPTIFTSWKVNISLAIRVVTIAELVGAVTGIGHQLSVAQELFSVADVFAWTLVLVALLFLLEAVVARVEARVLRWRV